MRTNAHSLPRHLVAGNLALGVVLEMAVALEPPFDDAAELRGEGVVVEEVVHAQAGAGGLGGVRGPDAFVRCAVGGAAELDFFEAVDDLVEVEDEVGAVRDEEATRAVETWMKIEGSVNR